MKSINIGLIGLGTVGSGVYKLLKKNTSKIYKKTNIRINLKRIADIDSKKAKELKIEKKIFTHNAYDIINDRGIDIVIELIGGIKKAKEFIINSLKNGKHIVTANKALLSQFGNQIYRTAQKNKAFIGFEASVGGSIPIIKIIRESLAGNRIKKIMGIINGTTNFILTKMEEKEIDFSRALKVAQEKGLAEADPMLDISGEDAAHKIQILTAQAYNTYIPFNNIYFEGISNIDLNDILYVKELGYKIKLLAIAKIEPKNEIDCRVHPTIIPESHILSSVQNEFNAILVEGDGSDTQIFYGKGAGSLPTASAIVGDIVDIAKNINAQKPENIYNDFNFQNKLSLKDYKNISCRYYLRFHTVDRPGVLAQISRILGNNNISLTSVMQKETGKKIVPIVMLTHKANEANVQKALNKINKLAISRFPSKMIRIEGRE